MKGLSISVSVQQLVVLVVIAIAGVVLAVAKLVPAEPIWSAISGFAAGLLLNRK